MKNHTKAPLPFQGQKRNFIKKFKEALLEFPTDAIYIDLFGGSGLLSQTVKSVLPNAKVIYNDFDNYSNRLKNINKTNLLLSKIRHLISDIPFKNDRIPSEIKDKIIDLIEKENGFVDFITLSAALLFSGNYKTNLKDLKKQTFYNSVPKSDYNADGYLEDVEIISRDYREIFEIYKNVDNVVFLLDPPYLSTDVKTYTDEKYWKLTDYLNVLKVIENKKFFYFTSSKSQIIDLLEWLDKNNYGYSPFSNAKKAITNNQVTHNASYEDIMIYNI